MPDFASDVKISNVGYGQNGYNGPSSLTPAQARKVSKTYASLASDSTNATAAPWADQTRTISAKPIKTTPTMRSRNGEGGKIPTSLNRGSVKPSVKPARKGNMAR